MFYYKVNNLLNVKGNADYKGLHVDSISGVSQVLPYNLQQNNYCILASTEDITHEDLIKLTEEEYTISKEQIMSEYPEAQEKESNKIQELEQQLLELQEYIINKEAEELLNQGGM